jgi:hypothetical protein
VGNEVRATHLALWDVFCQFLGLTFGDYGLVRVVGKLSMSVHELNVEVRSLVPTQDLDTRKLRALVGCVRIRTYKIRLKQQKGKNSFTSVPMHASPTAQPARFISELCLDLSSRIARASVGT